jgi:hypothetical protein
VAINTQFRDEIDGEILDSGSIEGQELPGLHDVRYPHLRLIDPYGDTVFSHYQVRHGVLAELERFAAERPSPGIDGLLAVARRCSTETHTRVYLLGD